MIAAPVAKCPSTIDVARTCRVSSPRPAPTACRAFLARLPRAYAPPDGHVPPSPLAPPVPRATRTRRDAGAEVAREYFPDSILETPADLDAYFLQPGRLVQPELPVPGGHDATPPPGGTPGENALPGVPARGRSVFSRAWAMLRRLASFLGMGAQHSKLEHSSAEDASLDSFTPSEEAFGVEALSREEEAGGTRGRQGRDAAGRSLSAAAVTLAGPDGFADGASSAADHGPEVAVIDPALDVGVAELGGDFLSVDPGMMDVSGG